MAEYKPDRQRKKSMMTRFKRALRNKSMWKHIALEGSLVLFVLTILFYDALVNWVSKPTAKPNEIVEKAIGQNADKIAEKEKKQIFDKVRTLIADRKLDEATEEMQRYLMRDPSNADAHYLMGTVYLQKGQVLSAFEHLQEAVKRNPNHLEAHKTLGQLYLISGNIKAAQNTASLLTKQSEYLKDGHLLESEIARAEGNLDKAFAKLQEALKGSKEPPNFRVSAFLANLYVQKGNRPKAEELMNKFNRNTLNANDLVTLAKFYLSITALENAVAVYKEGLRRYPQDPEVNYAYGQYLFEKGNFKDAATHFKRAMTVMPDVPIIAYRTGQSLLAARALEEAGVFIDQLLERNQNDLLALRLNAQYRLQRGERKKALDTLQQIARLTPNTPRIYLVLAELYLAEGIVNLAEKNALLAIDRGEKVAAPWMILGDVYFRRRQFAKALTYYEKVLAVQPDNLSLMLQMGDAHLNLGQGSKADDLYQKALDRYPNAKFIKNKVAWARVAAGDLVGALAISRQYFNDSPEDTNALAGYVNVLVVNNRLNDALSLVRQNLMRQRERDAWIVNLMLGDLYFLKKDFPSAADSYRQALKQHPADVNLMINVGVRYERMNLGKEAESLYISAQKRFPQNMLFVNHLAWFYVENMNEPRKAAQLVSALESDAEGSAVKDTIGWYYYKIGDFKSSEYYLREAAILEPENVFVRGHLALALFGMKKNNEAYAEAKRAVDTLPDSPLRVKLMEVISKAGSKGAK
jgi:tetratricopeptide (TPR) repeat protein